MYYLRIFVQRLHNCLHDSFKNLKLTSVGNFGMCAFSLIHYRFYCCSFNCFTDILDAVTVR